MSSPNLNNQTYENINSLNEVIDREIEDIIVWFSSNSHVKTPRDERERYVFSTKALDYIMDNIYKPERISIKKELDDCGNLFCYILDYKEEVIKEKLREISAARFAKRACNH